MLKLPSLRSGKKEITQRSRLVRLVLILAPLALFFTFVPWSGHAQQAHAATISCPEQIQYGSTDASSGGLVSLLQGELNQIDSMIFKLSIDGQFGSHTEAAVVTFQKVAFPNDSSQWDGQVGPHTWGALGMCKSSGISGGGCTTANGLRACISVSVSAGRLEPDGYILASNFNNVYLDLLQGSVTRYCNDAAETAGGPFYGQHITPYSYYGCDVPYGSGETFVTVLTGTTDSGAYVFAVSPPQYT